MLRTAVCSLVVATLTCLATPVAAGQPTGEGTADLQSPGASPTSAELSLSGPLFAEGSSAGGVAMGRAGGARWSPAETRLARKAGSGLLAGVIGAAGAGLVGGAIGSVFTGSSSQRPYGRARSSGITNGGMVIGSIAGFLGAPPYGIHLAGRRYGEEGRLDMAYLGGGLGLLGGLAAGGGILSIDAANGLSVLGLVASASIVGVGPIVGAIIGWENSRWDSSTTASTSADDSRKRARFRVVPFVGGDEQTGPGLGVNLAF